MPRSKTERPRSSSQWILPVAAVVRRDCVLQEFDGHVAEGLSAEVAHVVGEVAGGEGGVSVVEFDGYGGLVFHDVGNFGVSESNGDVVVAMPMHLGLSVGADLDVEDADVLVFKGEVMVRFVGDLKFGRGGLSDHQGGTDTSDAEEKGVVRHAGDCTPEVWIWVCRLSKQIFGLLDLVICGRD